MITLKQGIAFRASYVDTKITLLYLYSRLYFIKKTKKFKANFKLNYIVIKFLFESRRMRFVYLITLHSYL